MSKLTAKGTLPDGRVIVMKELTCADELRVAADADAHGGGQSARQIISTLSAVKRSLVSVGGEDFPQSDYECQAFRDLWSSTEWVCIQSLFERLHTAEEEAIATFREGIAIQA